MTRSPERTQFLADILTTAVETGWPWFQWSHYQYINDFSDPRNPKLVKCVDDGTDHGSEPMAIAHEMNDDEDGYKDEALVLDLDAVARGLKMWIASLSDQEREHGQRSWRATMLKAEREHDAGEFDACDADSIAQYALLGENRYA